MQGLLNYLSSIHPLSAELVGYLENSIKYQEVRKGQTLLKAGQICHYIYFIEAGLIRCFYRNEHLDVSSWFMKEGDVITSIESFYKRQISYEWIQTLENCKLWYITYEELYTIYKQYPEFNYIGRELTQNYYILWTQLLHAMRMKSAEEKYQWLLDSFPEYILRIPAKYLSSWLSISETHFSDVKRRYTTRS